MNISRLQPNFKKELPVIPLRELIIFPHTIIPFFVGRGASLHALEAAMAQNRDIIVGFQKNKNKNPGADDIHITGTLCHIIQMLKLPDGNIRVLAEGKQRVTLQRFFNKKDITMVQFRPFEEKSKLGNRQTALLMNAVQESFTNYARQNKRIPREVLNNIEKAETPEKLIGQICLHLNLSMEEKIDFLSEKDIHNRLSLLNEKISLENEYSNIKKDLSSRVRKKMEKTQKEYFLNEQIKEIQKELGDKKDDPSGARELESRLKEKNLPEEVRAKADSELKRLERLQPMSPESGILRTYLEWICDLPWKKNSKDRLDLKKAHQVLDEDHFDLKKAKDRILDFIAIHQLSETQKGPILCFVGPPGTGKTSLGRSVARALNREFVRISLGGVRDEAEIRGHRKTYVGALPGKVIQSLKKAGSSNPVFLLDEIDKMSSDFRGDPSAALLEVLDPEQNSTFSDHYLEVPYDLSRVMFITTANSLHSIPRPLLDRMEIIEVPGYTEIEKLTIARNYILPKQLKTSGMNRADFSIGDKALLEIIRKYTLESGVRNLEREINRVIRKIAREAITAFQQRAGRYLINSQALHQYQDELYGVYSTPEQGDEEFPAHTIHRTINKNDIRTLLGKPVFEENDLKIETGIGMVVGLAWTEAGGRVLPVEVSLLKGNGKLILTGKLGDVMKESAQIAVSFLQGYAEVLNIDPEFQKDQDIHIHVPEGAIPKDGPSAGITMTAALLSAVRKKPIQAGIAMTGEITLTGRLLPIGGIKEKVLAAHRNKRSMVLLPEKNRRDAEELPEEIQKAMGFHYFSSVPKALEFLFS